MKVISFFSFSRVCAGRGPCQRRAPTGDGSPPRSGVVASRRGSRSPPGSFSRDGVHASAGVLYWRPVGKVGPPSLSNNRHKARRCGCLPAGLSASLCFCPSGCVRLVVHPMLGALFYFEVNQKGNWAFHGGCSLLF